VQGGVQGGVVGGVVGSPAPPPPPKDTGPKMVSAQIARGQLLINPNSDPYRVKLPPALARGNATFVAVLRVCVSAQGNVTDVRIVRPAGPAIDPQIPLVLRRWRYRPLLMDGRPAPFCYMLRYEISAR
jgi:periplasmic protein TonB